MTDERLAELFAQGTAPELDAAFARRVDARIARTRLGLRLPGLAMRALVILAFAATVFVTAVAIGPALTRLTGEWPQFMGVPVPLILVVVGVGFAVRAAQFVRSGLG